MTKASDENDKALIAEINAEIKIIGDRSTFMLGYLTLVLAIYFSELYS